MVHPRGGTEPEDPSSPAKGSCEWLCNPALETTLLPQIVATHRSGDPLVRSSYQGFLSNTQNWAKSQQTRHSGSHRDSGVFQSPALGILTRWEFHPYIPLGDSRSQAVLFCRPHFPCTSQAKTHSLRIPVGQCSRLETTWNSRGNRWLTFLQIGQLSSSLLALGSLGGPDRRSPSPLTMQQSCCSRM